MAYSNFSWNQFFAQPQSYLTDGKSYFHDSQNDGVKTRLTLGGTQDAWSDPSTFVLFNAKTALDIYYGADWVTSQDPDTYNYLLKDPWVYHTDFGTIPNTNYSSLPDTWTELTPIPLGSQVFNISNLGAARGIEFQCVPYQSNPSHLEVEFVDNGTSTTYGYCGYSAPTKVDVEIYGPSTGMSLGKLYFTAGVFKKTANLSSVSIADILFGVFVRPVGNDVKASLVINGVEIYSRTSTNGVVNSANFGFIDELDKDQNFYNAIQGMPGAFPITSRYFQVTMTSEEGVGTQDIFDSSLYGSTPLDSSGYLNVQDIKVGYYAAPSGPKTPESGGFPTMAVWGNIAYFTSPAYPREIVVTVPPPERVKFPLPDVRYYSKFDNYSVTSDNRPLSDLADRDSQIIAMLVPATSIAAAPTFLGQRAKIGNTMYIAVDTLSPSDWVLFKNF